MQKLWRIKDLLEWTTRYFLDKGIAESRLEAEILLAHALKKDRVYLYANYEEPINTEEREYYRETIKRRLASEPIAYITGHKEFMSLDFKINPDVLIPRADTEVLVETALAVARAENMHRLIDVGTGSGAIAVSLAVYLETPEIFATDISAQALAVAQENARLHGVKIDFQQGDLLQAFLSMAVNKNERSTADREGQFALVDMITANLPYIPTGDIQLDPQVKEFEPHLALFGGEDGLDLYRRLIPQAYTLLRPGGFLFIEIDPRQAGEVVKIMPGFTEIKITQDMAGRERVVQARRGNDNGNEIL